MKKPKLNQNEKAKSKIHSYPKEIKQKLILVRDIILKTAAETESIAEIEETLKWGEISFLVKHGSTIRMGWKSTNPSQYAIYFNCNTSLVETFKAIYGDLFKYEKNRAILFDLEDDIPEEQLKDCIEMALQYHLLKDKPFLGR